MEGKSFFDVGCNAGFFCGFAAYAGAARVLGLDSHAEFIATARERFPKLEFICQSWDKLPDEKFDIILLSSALHYASDQPALIDRIMQHLKKDGIFILEAGIAPGDDAVWVETKRGDVDTRSFPTMPMMVDILGKYAFRLMGSSVGQRSDPNPRSVFHIRHRAPYAFLLFDKPGSGKSSVARWISSQKNATLVSGDQLLIRTLKGEIGGEEFRGFLRKHFTGSKELRALFDKVYASGNAVHLLSIALDSAAERDFVFDGYVPHAHHEEVVSFFEARGFVPVIASPRAPRLSKPTPVEKYDAYLEHLKRG